MKTPPKAVIPAAFYVNSIAFDWWEPLRAGSFERAVEMAKARGFEATISTFEHGVVARWSPTDGALVYNRAVALPNEPELVGVEHPAEPPAKVLVESRDGAGWTPECVIALAEFLAEFADVLPEADVADLTGLRVGQSLQLDATDGPVFRVTRVPPLPGSP